MNQLIGPNVQVVLSLREGKGFAKIKNSTCIVASLNGLSLETDLINPDPNPQYITDLVWEASKNALRKMRSGQEPLKIECLEVKENGTKDRIGYLLLSMRTAQIITKKNDNNIKMNWYKLLGLRSDMRAEKPEFYISFTIEELISDVDHVFGITELKCQSEVPLVDEGIEISSVQVKVDCENQGPYYKSNKRLDENLGPPILDDSLAYKIVDELETWKERQQELFRVELKRKEEYHLNRLSEEWQIRRESLESKLNCSVEQCKLLANSLNDATDDLRVRRLQSLEKEARLVKVNEDLKWSYDRKLQELEDRSQKIQQDLTSKILTLEEQKKSFEAKIEVIRSENVRLTEIVKKQNEELATYDKGTVLQSQVDNLLHEMKSLECKLSNTQKSKTFFKEQWAKAVREIHQMKVEHQQAIEVQIKSSKEKLKHIDLEQLLRADSAALSNDKILLGQIQKEIDVIKPTPSFMLNEPQESVFTPSYNSASRSHVNYNKGRNFPILNEQDERLRKLIVERDLLLKTGNYTIDDAIIVKLNTEIQSMLINS